MPSFDQMLLIKITVTIGNRTLISIIVLDFGDI